MLRISAKFLIALMTLSFAGSAQCYAADKQSSRRCGPIFHTGPTGLAVIFGTLYREAEWGLPNFGEHPKTDMRLTVSIVRLDFPLRIEVNGELNMKRKVTLVREIQIVRSHATDQLLPDTGHWRAAQPEAACFQGCSNS